MNALAPRKKLDSALTTESESAGSVVATKIKTRSIKK